MRPLHNRLQAIALPFLVGAIIILVMKGGVQLHSTPAHSYGGQHSHILY